MKKTARSARPGQEAPSSQLAFAAMIGARATLHDAVVAAGLSVLVAMLEEERTRLCGPRYAHAPDRAASRAGHVDGELAMGGRRVRVSRPRVRGVEGTEVPLETWEQFAGADPLTPRAVEQMVLGVSTRKYERSIEAPPPGIATRGTSKSAVSRRFVAATRERLTEMMSRDLGVLTLCAVMIDGIRVGDHLVLIALGVDERGEKHVLGLYEGATENTVCCSGLLDDLEARGLRTDRTMLFVIDGSKALAKAIRAKYGARALVQCSRPARSAEI